MITSLMMGWEGRPGDRHSVAGPGLSGPGPPASHGVQLELCRKFPRRFTRQSIQAPRPMEISRRLESPTSTQLRVTGSLSLGVT